MIRNLKVLGIALVALCALGVSSAGAAEFTVEKAPATVKASQTNIHKFNVTGQTVTCSTADFEGTASATTLTSVKVAALYSGCETAIGTTVNVTGFATKASEIGNANKCWYRLDAAGSAGLECNGGEVTVDAATCIVHIPAQNFASGVNYTDTTGNVDVSFNVTGITANHTDGFLCPMTSSGHSTVANLEGTASVTAEAGGVAIDASFDK